MDHAENLVHAPRRHGDVVGLVPKFAGGAEELVRTFCELADERDGAPDGKQRVHEAHARGNALVHVPLARERRLVGRVAAAGFQVVGLLFAQPAPPLAAVGDRAGDSAEQQQSQHEDGDEDAHVEACDVGVAPTAASGARLRGAFYSERAGECGPRRRRTDRQIDIIHWLQIGRHRGVKEMTNRTVDAGAEVRYPIRTAAAKAFARASWPIWWAVLTRQPG